MSKEKTEVPFTYYCGSLGGAMAMIISWERTHSILWAMLHNMCGWFYIIWFAIWGRT